MTVRVLLWMLGAIALGLTLIAWGFRGKRLNDHPVCRQCRFDLSGSPEGTITCPECGAGLKRQGSTLIGQRRRRPLAMALGSALAAMPLFAIGTAGFAMLTGTDLNAYKPLGVLVWEAKRSDSTRIQPIAAELLNRYNAKKLDDDQIATVVNTILEIQEDPQRAWSAEFGDLFESARSDKKASDAETQRFRNQAAVLSWKVRPRVRPGDPIPIVISLKEARIGGSSAIQSMLIFSSAIVDGTSVSPTGFMGMNTHLGWLQLYGKSNRMGWNGPSGEGSVLLTCPANMTPGSHTVKMKILIQTKPQANTVAWTTPREGDPETRAEEHEFAFEVMDSGRAGVEVVEPSAAEREKMEQVLDPRQAQLYRYAAFQPPHASIVFGIEDRPMEGAFDVFWRVKDQTWKVGSFSTGTSADLQTRNYGPGMDQQRFVSEQVAGIDLDIDKADVILRPSAAVASRTLELERIYGAEIIYKDVMVSVHDMPAVRSRSPASSTKQQSPREEAPPSSGGGTKPEGGKGPSLFKSIHKLMGG